MDHSRRLALTAGILYLLTVTTSIPALAIKAPILADPHALERADAVLALRWASVLEIALAAACVGTAVTLWPLLRRWGEAAALGFVAARTVEAGTILTGVGAMLALASLPRTSDSDATLIAIHDWAFLLGPGLIAAVNALLIAPLVWRARLVPRALPAFGLIGAPLLLASATGTMFGLVDQVSPIAGLLALPIAVWETGLGACLVIRGARSVEGRVAD